MIQLHLILMMNIKVMNKEYTEDFGVEINSEVYAQDFDDAGWNPIVDEPDNNHVNPYEIPNN